MNVFSNNTKKIAIMEEGGKIAADIRNGLMDMLAPGLPTMALEERAKKLFADYGVEPSFLGYQGYPYAIITCINDEVVHGMPSERLIALGDIVTIDLGVYHRGYHTDTADTREVITDNEQGFLQVGREALTHAIAQATSGKHIGDISSAMQHVIEKAGYNVIRAFVGHEIGRQMHEELQIPCFGKAGTGVVLEKGMTLAIEVMYMKGSHAVSILDDEWTAVTRDGSLSAMFEHTVAITESNPLILTG